jgi:epidermal growth factor receptor substrate 15
LTNYLIVLFLKTLNKTAPTAWVVSASDKAKYDEMFSNLDMDLDGFVTGGDVKNVFLETGLPQSTLAHIWLDFFLYYKLKVNLY